MILLNIIKYIAYMINQISSQIMKMGYFFNLSTSSKKEKKAREHYYWTPGLYLHFTNENNHLKNLNSL